MKNSPRNTEGIFRRRQNGLTPKGRPPAKPAVPSQYLATDGMKPAAKAGGPPVLSRTNPSLDHPGAVRSEGVRTLDIDMTLDDEKPDGKKKGRGFLRGWRPSRKFYKRAAIVLGILLLLLLGYFAYKLLIASGNIFRGGGQSLIGDNGIDKNKLQHEGDGRINILLAATSEDDPNHPGGVLTDSIMIASIDPVNKGVALVSIPRDLWVEMPECTLYSEEKINAVYQCGEEMKFKENGYPEGGMGYLQKTVETVTGLNINYHAKINYTAFRQAVDAVGGVDISIDSPDPRGIYDPNFDWTCNYQCHQVKHANGPAHLNGEQALYLARSRNSAGGYGMPRGDFDRTEYQRKMLISLKEKATSLDTLSNPVKLSALIDSIGNNLVTNFSRDDMLKLYDLAKNIPGDKSKSIGLADGDEAVLTTGSAGGASVVQPTAGLFDYSQVQAFLRRQLPDPYIINEAPTIALYNGTDVPGLATEQKALLESYGYKVVAVGDAPTKDYSSTKFYDSTNGAKEITRRYLQNRYDTQATNDQLPEGINPEYETGKVDEQGNPEAPKRAEYVIILGQDISN